MASSLLSVVYLTCRMRVGLQVVISKLIALTASVAAGALAVKDILRGVMKVICQAGAPVPQVLDNLCGTSASRKRTLLQSCRGLP